MDHEVTSIYEKSRDAVVKIHALRQIQIGNLLLLPSYRIATGFFIDKDGHILTTATAVDDADTCWIDWRGQRINARVVGRDAQTNLAVLKIDPVDGAPTPFLTQGDSDSLRVGSMVIAVAFPYDQPSVPVVGFVSGLDIQSNGHVFPTTHIRAGCRLSPGQAGGPLLNVHGEVIGIAIAEHADGQCCALPINAAHKISQDILAFGQAQHPWVGLRVSERLPAANAAEPGQRQVFVQQVFSNTPAAVAGFHDGDILVTITSNEVRRSADVLNTMFYHRVGDKVEFTVLRDGLEQKIILTVGGRPAQEAFGFVSAPQAVSPPEPPVVPRPVALPVSEP
ncbi:MAG TPA: trypsin-like peptidase domain-containing protein [Verrucomicrobiae bacterium]|nr:trypsin-like peptidase domain-containing protein [Verrucomicrobiae bacterium]